MLSPSTRWSLAVVLFLGACGSTQTIADGGGDGGTDGGDDGGVRAVPPRIPWLDEGAPPIALAPCPEGWREVPGALVTECDPYPEGGPETCGFGDAHFPGEPGCTAIGDPCPLGDYATELPTEGSILYVKEGAATGGDGSLSAPYAALSEVSWFSVASGTTLALAKGSYEGVLPLRAGVQVIGACARDTILTGLDAPIAAVVSVVSGGGPATLRNLSIVGAPQIGAKVEAGRALALHGVLVDRATVVGVLATGTNTELTLTNSVIRATQARESVGTHGRGIDIERGARLQATRFIVSDNHQFGVYGSGEGTELELVGGVIRDTQPRVIDRSAGYGLYLIYGAHFVGSQVLVTGNHTLGVLAEHAGTEVRLSDSIVRATRPQRADAYFGRGLSAQFGARFDGTRVLFAENHDLAISVLGASSEVTLSDIVIRDTRPQESDLRNGKGLSAQDGAKVTGARMLFLRNHDVAIAGATAGTRLLLSDVAILDTQAEASDSRSGRGINMERGVRLEGTRVLIADSHELGVGVIAAGTEVTFTDLVIRDTQPPPSGHLGGTGLQVQEGASVDATRLQIDGAVSLGVMVASGAVGDFEDLSVTRVLQSGCAMTTCPELAFGYGVAAVAGTLRVTGFDVSDAEICGVFLSAHPAYSTPTSLDIASGTVTESAIGACVQIDGYDIGRLSTEVRYINNGINLDSTMLPVPQPIMGPSL